MPSFTVFLTNICFSSSSINTKKIMRCVPPSLHVCDFISLFTCWNGKGTHLRGKFFRKELLNPCQVNKSFLHSLPLKRLEHFSNPFRFQVVLEIKYCSEIDYIIKRVTFVWSSFLDLKFHSVLSNHFMKELFLLSRQFCMQNINIDQESNIRYIFQ